MHLCDIPLLIIDFGDRLKTTLVLITRGPNLFGLYAKKFGYDSFGLRIGGSEYAVKGAWVFIPMVASQLGKAGSLFPDCGHDVLMVHILGS